MTVFRPLFTNEEHAPLQSSAVQWRSWLRVQYGVGKMSYGFKKCCKCAQWKLKVDLVTNFPNFESKSSKYSLKSGIKFKSGLEYYKSGLDYSRLVKNSCSQYDSVSRGNVECIISQRVALGYMPFSHHMTQWCPVVVLAVKTMELLWVIYSSLMRPPTLRRQPLHQPENN